MSKLQDEKRIAEFMNIALRTADVDLKQYQDLSAEEMNVTNDSHAKQILGLLQEHGKTDDLRMALLALGGMLVQTKIQEIFEKREEDQAIAN